MRRLHPLPDAISDGNFGRTKKLNPYYYRLRHGLLHGIDIALLATLPMSGTDGQTRPKHNPSFSRGITTLAFMNVSMRTDMYTFANTQSHAYIHVHIRRYTYTHVDIRILRSY